jgi:hypothetical protein
MLLSDYSVRRPLLSQQRGNSSGHDLGMSLWLLGCPEAAGDMSHAQQYTTNRAWRTQETVPWARQTEIFAQRRSFVLAPGQLAFC